MSSIPSCSANPITVTAPMYVFRHPAAENKKEEIFSHALGLTNTTIYSRHAQLASAPAKTDCVTAACYIAINAFGANFCPDIYEVNTIRRIPASMTLCGWEVQPIAKLEEIRPGDMLFLSKTASRINHMAVCLNAFLVFHSNMDDTTGVIETYQKLFEKYKPIRDPFDLATNEPSETNSEAGSAASSVDNTRTGLLRSHSVDSMFYDPAALTSTVRRSLSPIASSPSISVDLDQVEQRIVRSASGLRLRQTSDSVPTPGLSSVITGSDVLSPEVDETEKFLATNASSSPIQDSSSIPSRSESLGPSPLRKLLTDLRVTREGIGKMQVSQQEKLENNSSNLLRS